MTGRDRVGVDARGTIGDVELIGERKPDKAHRLAGAHKTVGILPRKALGFGLLVILAGIIIWVWPIIDVYVISYFKLLDTGPKVVGWGIILIVVAILVKMILNPIIDLILR